MALTVERTEKERLVSFYTIVAYTGPLAGWHYKDHTPRTLSLMWAANSDSREKKIRQLETLLAGLNSSDGSIAWNANEDNPSEFTLNKGLVAYMKKHAHRHKFQRVQLNSPPLSASCEIDIYAKKNGNPLGHNMAVVVRDVSTAECYADRVATFYAATAVLPAVRVKEERIAIMNEFLAHVAKG